MKRFHARKLLRMTMLLLPRKWRFKINQSLIRLPINDDIDLRVKIAHRKEELEQAFHLLYESYCHMGYMTPNEAELRVTKYHALPSTTTIVAMIGDEVVGTVSLIRDGNYGFPSDCLVDKDELRANKLRLVEVSSLAV